MVHAMGINGARRRSHDPTAARPEVGLGWPESTHRAASLDCSEGSKERVAGRARLDRVESGGLRRTGATGHRAEPDYNQRYTVGGCSRNCASSQR